SAGHAEDIRRLAARFAPGEGGVINRLRVDAPSQVNLRVRVAEVSRRVIKQFGFNWESLFSSGGFLLGLATGNPVVSGGSFLTRRSNNNNVFGGVRQGRLNLNVLVDALANEGLLTVLAEPNLTALSGETASFLAGGEFPIPVPQGNNVVTIEFKRFGVSLGFTPTLIDGDRINLRVNPEVSELTSNGSITINNFVIPALTTRRAETTVELGSGQSFAIAGLLKSDLDHDIKKLPGLGDLPVLGTLFRSDTFKRGETELVIIVTPYVVRPVSSARALHAPTDGLIPPNDAERILLGRNYSEQSGKQRTGNPISPGRRLIGPVGFILE
ncbi:MAG: type II and III secretion system protein family protein, partial [Rhodospirillales bacterium]|nr:type II and III secretion system protein family protein [Rhodospirillales bacterium]